MAINPNQETKYHEVGDLRSHERRTNDFLMLKSLG